ncbi:unnamed protein product [Toxocara canis]|uniref:Uncharacterized protein n=1 Tax=Toxocara canis TaxID=6265 RepID=A0A183V6R6_TOXCA|nr:unnamed protein product [Toxocara canis]
MLRKRWGMQTIVPRVFLSTREQKETTKIDEDESGEVRKKEKVRKAQALYEPWMDSKLIVEQSKQDAILQPKPQHPQVKHRSQFVFDSEYTKTASITPTSRFILQCNSKTLGMHPSFKRPTTESQKLLIEGEYAEFYAWVLNGKETDLTTAEIIRLLFGKNRNTRRKRVTANSTE